MTTAATSHRTLLEFYQEFCRRMAFTPQLVVTTATDDQTLQIWGLLNEEVEELAARFDWPALTRRYTFTYTGNVTSGSESYIAVQLANQGAGTVPDGTTIGGFKAMIPNTLWDTTNRLMVNGPLNESQWAQLLIFTGATGPIRYYRFHNTNLEIFPAPSTSTAFEFQYYSQWAVCPVSPNQLKRTPYFENDTDICLLPDRCIQLGLRWRYLEAKGLPYAERQRSYEVAVADAMGSAGQAGEVRMDSDPLNANVGPGLLVAAGSWPL